MNRLQSLDAPEQFCVTLNRTERDRPGEGDPRRSSTRTRSTPRRAMRAQARHDEISGRDRTHFCGAYWGWGFHEDGVVSAVRVAERARGRRAVTAQRALRGHDPPPPLRGPRARVPPPPRARLRRPRRAAAAARRARSSRAGPGSCASAARDYLGDPARRSPTPCARSSRGGTGSDPAARSGCSPSRARSGTASTRSASTTASTPRASALEAVVAEVTNTPWGERHAYVLPRGGDGPVLDGELDKALHVSPFMGMDQRYAWRATRPGATLSVHIASTEHGAPAFDATLALRRRQLTRALAGAASPLRYPAATLRVLALIYGHARRAQAAARARPPPPGGGRADDRRAPRRASSSRCCAGSHDRRARRSSRAASATCSARGVPPRRRSRSAPSASGARCCAAAAAWPSPTPTACWDSPDLAAVDPRRGAQRRRARRAAPAARAVRGPWQRAPGSLARNTPRAQPPRHRRPLRPRQRARSR